MAALFGRRGEKAAHEVPQAETDRATVGPREGLAAEVTVRPSLQSWAGA